MRFKYDHCCLTGPWNEVIHKGALSRSLARISNTNYISPTVSVTHAHAPGGSKECHYTALANNAEAGRHFMRAHSKHKASLAWKSTARARVELQETHYEIMAVLVLLSRILRVGSSSFSLSLPLLFPWRTRPRAWLYDFIEPWTRAREKEREGGRIVSRKRTRLQDTTFASRARRAAPAFLSLLFLW